MLLWPLPERPCYRHVPRAGRKRLYIEFVHKEGQMKDQTKKKNPGENHVIFSLDNMLLMFTSLRLAPLLLIIYNYIWKLVRHRARSNPVPGK